MAETDLAMCLCFLFLFLIRYGVIMICLFLLPVYISYVHGTI